ncbi:MAG: N-acetyltransferase [Gammaproteobacteria bacterium]|nr:MAG: N-acetyltransferase [Gammaproteobacteria bacterium]
MTVIKRIRAEQTYPLRQEILRPHRPAVECRFPNDFDDTTAHFGALDSGRIVGILSVYLASNEQLGIAHSWQLRAMATSEDHRGKGLGLRLLEAAESYVSAQGGKCIWANARLHALGFYKKAGYAAHGERFHIAHVGPHVLVTRMLN